MEGSAMDFLLHLYHSDFADPLRDPKFSEDPRWSFHKLCESLLIACSRAGQGLHANHCQDRFYALWSMEQQHVPTELGNTLIERTETLKLMKPEYVISFIRLIYHTMDDWFLGESGKQLSIHDRVAFDLIELSGFPSLEPENNFLALWALQKIVSFNEIKISDVFERYVTSIYIENLSGLMTCIFERISQLVSMNVLDWKIFISRCMLEVINCFIEVARRSPKFLDTIIEANILGLLRPFLEVELRMTSFPIAKHEGDMLMTFDDSDLVVLGLINEHGLMQLFNDPLFLYTRTRTILAHEFAGILPRLKEKSPSMFEK
ncbi:hypothetical protein BDZ94DRAFT_651454 [Collybia nuda]|uniref:Uncharacterized protein n=1 Tax=Collybia nuda TaxID=64659 RepID=A0A9P6CI91_9AGAR|nr:hypothetical protein BDZ94DRAFT_651454 [Collybia nuda]